MKLRKSDDEVLGTVDGESKPVSIVAMFRITGKGCQMRYDAGTYHFCNLICKSKEKYDCFINELMSRHRCWTSKFDDKY